VLVLAVFVLLMAIILALHLPPRDPPGAVA